MDLNKLRTRKGKIDVYLKKQGWDVANRASVIPEVDTKQSDFLAHSYKTVAETLKNDLESKYVDYLPPRRARRSDRHRRGQTHLKRSAYRAEAGGTVRRRYQA